MKKLKYFIFISVLILGVFVPKTFKKENTVDPVCTGVSDISLRFDPSDLNNLKLKNKEVVKKFGGWLPTKNDYNFYVPTILIKDSTQLKAKARLKGNFTDSRDTSLLSLRVKLKKGLIDSVSKFSITHPKVKFFIDEYVFHKLAKSLGILQVDYDFKWVEINNKQNLFAFEEHFNEDYLIKRGLKGVIVCYEEMHEVLDYEYQTRGSSYSTQKSWRIAPIKCYNCPKGDSSQKQIWYQEAADLLNDFRAGKLKTSQVFDSESYAKLCALTDMVGHGHSLAYRNIKYYYNPDKKKLFPIAFDHHAGILNISYNARSGTFHKFAGMVNSHFKDDLVLEHRIFQDLSFFKLYVKYLKEFGESGLKRELKSFEKEHNAKVELLNCAFKNYKANKNRSKNVIRRNGNISLTKLNTFKHANIFKNKIESQTYYAIENITGMPLEVKLKDSLINVPPSNGSELFLIQKTVDFNKLNIRIVGTENFVKNKVYNYSNNTYPVVN